LGNEILRSNPTSQAITLGLTLRDLEPFIGTRARVSEIMNRKRPLTLAMIRKLSAGLGIPADALIIASAA
jgi:antitoxin component HigA of HigAB toxin-antitoxin module